MRHTAVSSPEVSCRLSFAGARVRHFSVRDASPPKHEKLATMTPAMLENAVRNIIVTSSSEEEIRNRIACELGYSEKVNLFTGFTTDTEPRCGAPIFQGSRLKDSSLVGMVILCHHGEKVVVE